MGGGLLSWHLYLAIAGETAVDHLVLGARRDYRPRDPLPNPFDFGSASENLKHALFSAPVAGVGGGGTSGLLELLLPPWPSSLPYGDPYPRASESY